MIDLDNTLANYTHGLRYHLRRSHAYGPLTGYAMHDPCEYELWRDPSWPFGSWEEQAAATVKMDIFAAGPQPPEDDKLLWIDTNASTGGLKYWNGTGWVYVPVAYT